jgi:hypothetical protein
MPEENSASGGSLHTSAKNGTKPEQKKRVTIAIPEGLDQALEIFCSGTGQMKNEVVAAALSEYLSQNRKLLQEALESATNHISRFLVPSSARHRRA